LTLVLVCGAAYGLLLVVPYLVNDLPTVGAEGPGDLWPYQGGGAVATLWGVAAILTFIVGPIGAYAAPLWAIFLMWRDRRVLPVREWLALGAAVICGVAFWAGFGSPFGEALIAWYLD
jgi:hypothetical protein